MQNCFPQWLYYFTFLSAICEGSNFSISLLKLDSSHSGEYELCLILVLVCLSLIADVEHLFICFTGHLYISLERCLFKSCTHFFQLGYWSFYCRDVIVLIYSGYKSLIRYMICRYFLPHCLFTFSMEFFNAEKKNFGEI